MIGSERAAKQAERVAGIIRARSKTHGEADVQFVTLARLWGEFLGVEVSAQQTMYMMLLAKVSRVAVGGIAAEHVEDIAGYAALVLGDMERERTACLNPTPEQERDAHRADVEKMWNELRRVGPSGGDAPLTDEARAAIIAGYERLRFPPDVTKVTGDEALNRNSEPAPTAKAPASAEQVEAAFRSVVHADRAAYLRRMLNAAENEFRAYTGEGDDYES